MAVIGHQKTECADIPYMVWQSGGVGVQWCGEGVAPHIKLAGWLMGGANGAA